MAMIQCPECGKDVSDTASCCIHCGYLLANEKKSDLRKKKSGKKVVGCVLACLMIAIVAFGAFVLYQNNWAVNDVIKTISEGHMSCVFGHEWEEATCVEPKRCSVCNLTQGNVIEHEWKEATCTDAKTCTQCWKTTGMSLGHTTKYGTCSRCNTYVTDLQEKYYEIAKEIDNTLLVSMEEVALNLYYATFFTGSTRNSYVIKSIEYSREAYDDLNRIISMTGSYKEFNDIRNHLKKAQECLPIYADGVTIDNSTIVSCAEEIKQSSQDALEYIKKAIDYEFK